MVTSNRKQVIIIKNETRGLVIIINSLKETTGKTLDKEWVHLILIAKQMGLSPEKVRNFIKQDLTPMAENKIHNT